MSETTVLKSFAELADALDLADPPDWTDEVAVQPANPVVELVDPLLDLEALFGDLQQAGATLAAITRRDQETRALALRDLERYDAVVAEQRQAEEVLGRARQIRQEAESLAEQAFAEEARTAASRVVAMALQAETAAGRIAEQRRDEAERLAGELDLERLLAERQRAEAAEHAKAAEAERAGRLAGAVARAKEALAAGRFEEAKALLGTIASENPDNADVASLAESMRRQELLVKVNAAEEVLWLSRREGRRDPAAAVEHLEALDVDGLPDELARQVFGEWARACSRLCRERGLVEPLRYAPDPGRGAVISRGAPDDPYVVVSALGLGPAWQKGSPVSERQLRRARPLR